MPWNQKIIKKGNDILKSIDFKNVTPNKENVLDFLKQQPEKIKIVIIGQDPYPTRGAANGKAFAVNSDSPIPMSLKNIFKEIKEVKGIVSADRTLEHWTNQGVMLLNASLTTVIGKSNEHKNIWNNYIKDVIKFLDKSNKNIKWVLWGNFAQKIAKDIKGQKIIDAHPSPLSVRHRNKETFKILNFIDW